MSLSLNTTSSAVFGKRILPSDSGYAQARQQVIDSTQSDIAEDSVIFVADTVLENYEDQDKICEALQEGAQHIYHILHAPKEEEKNLIGKSNVALYVFKNYLGALSRLASFFNTGGGAEHQLHILDISHTLKRLSFCLLKAYQQDGNESVILHLTQDNDGQITADKKIREC